MQTSRWGALKARFGWRVERLILKDRAAIVAGAQILYRSLALGLAQLAYIPMGPVVDWGNEELVDALLAGLRQTAQQRGVFCLKLEPALAAGLEPARRLSYHGFQPSRQTVQWRSTILIDLDGTEDELLARFNKKHRQKLHKAVREGVVVQPGTAADLSAFMALLGQTAQRKEFAIYSPGYYRAAYDLFAANGQAQLLLATYHDAVLAVIMVFSLGPKAYCMFAASGDAHRDLMPTYLLHWEGIRWARAQGCLVYDYCGIPDEVARNPELYAHSESSDGLWGVYRFKRGFGGQVVCYVDSHDQVYRGILYSLYNQATRWLEIGLGETWHRRFFSG
jgi:peptidoglycan pentaglycine glycine transferase (the first glycine)